MQCLHETEGLSINDEHSVGIARKLAFTCPGTGTIHLYTGHCGHDFNGVPDASQELLLASELDKLLLAGCLRASSPWFYVFW